MDGAQKTKSGQHSFWPILGNFMDDKITFQEATKKENMIFIGIDNLKTKESKPSFTFIESCTKEIEKANIEINCIIAELVAGVFLSGHSLFNAKFGCLYCWHQSEYKENRTLYPNPKTEYAEKTDEDYRMSTNKCFNHFYPFGDLPRPISFPIDAISLGVALGKEFSACYFAQMT